MTESNVARLRKLCDDAAVPWGVAPFIAADDVRGLLDRIAALEVSNMKLKLMLEHTGLPFALDRIAALEKAAQKP